METGIALAMAKVLREYKNYKGKQNVGDFIILKNEVENLGNWESLKLSR